MGKKKSLGHNPLAYSMARHASFDFIAPNDDEKTSQKEHQYVQELKKAKSSTRKTNENSTNKVSASYYLEESLVKKIKVLANKKGTSYSAVVTYLLKDSLEGLS